MTCGILAVIIIIAASVLSLVDTKIQMPDCKDQGGIFIAMPNNIKITCETDSDVAAVIPCEHKFRSQVQPLWIINNKTYSSSRLPQDHYYDGKVLYVKNPKRKQNNTSYQCMVKSAVLQNAKATCLYRSSIGYLRIMCTSLSVQFSPHYYLHETEYLHSITTNITKMDESMTTYTITYSDAISGVECDSKLIQADSCTDGICSHVFEVASNLRQGVCNSDINVRVSANNLDQSVTLKIDSQNTFVKVSFDMTVPSINLKFINQPKQSRKFYTIEYGPLTNDCKNLPHNMEGYLSNSNLMTLQLHLDMDTTRICFVVTANSESKTVIVQGIHKSEIELLSSNSVHAKFISAVTVCVCGFVVCVSIATFGVYYKSHSLVKKELEIRDLECHQHSGEPRISILQEIDTSTTFFKVYTVDENILMKEFASKHHRRYDPLNGFGYFHATDEELDNFQLCEKVVLMDKSDGNIPKFSASNFKYALAKAHHSEQGWKDVYIQDTGTNRMLKPGSKFLYCANSKRITGITFHKIMCNEEPTECNLLRFVEENMLGFQETWVRYLYFQFTKPEYIKAYQHVIVHKKDGELMMGHGVRHFLGATGDGSRMTHPPNLTAHKEWEQVFIQCTTANRMLKPNTRLLFCAFMERINEKLHCKVYDVLKKCNMAEFGAQRIPGFKPEVGYGYYEFKETECLKLDQNVVLMHKDGSLYSGPGAKFFCIGNYSFNLICNDKVPPPSLHDTEWAHIFIQSHSSAGCRRELLPGTKFLYLEYSKY